MTAVSGFETFAGTRLVDKVAPIPDLPALAPERKDFDPEPAASPR